jgi:phospholipid-transporting ATPase
MYLFWILVGMSLAGAIGGVLFTVSRNEWKRYEYEGGLFF